ncbi:MAG: response regulator transcription factor [Coriobacteriales bacterium]|jgi:two-component system OmpR family response regulator
MNVLVVEDEKRLAAALKKILENAGYHVDAVFDGQTGLDYALSDMYDVIVLDVMLPRMDGFEVIQQIRRKGISTPVLFLTARSQLRDKVTGLDRGGDEYMTKPFQPEELLARLRALTRRKGEIVINEASFGDLTLMLDTCDLQCGDRSVHLSYREFEVAKIFITNPNQTISKDQLLLKVWGTEADVADNNVEAYISFLRKKLKYLESGVEIATLRMIGYRMQEKE